MNGWRLPDLIAITKRQTGIDEGTLWNKWEVEDEKPGIWQDIALLVPTGGISLAVAAGVNAAVALQHVREYEMQKAPSGTAFDKAHALSQYDPSLFWLAVEIVGVALDVGAAYKAVSA